MEGDAVWQRVQDSYVAYRRAGRAFEDATHAFLAEGVDRVALVRKAFCLPSIETVIAVAKRLPASDLMQLFPELVFWSSHIHGRAYNFHELIMSLPREWVVAHIEDVAEPLLQKGDEADYRQLLQLYRALDRGLTERLVQRALAHPDPLVREAGQDTLDWFDEQEAQ